MFEFDWSKDQPTAPPARPTALPAAHVQSTMLVHWQEHCLECAPPQCYATCLLYTARADRKCARLVYGIRRVPGTGLANYAADLKFRRWGKIETSLRPAGITVRTHRFIAGLDRLVTGMVNVASQCFLLISPFRRLNGALSLFRPKLLQRIGSATEADFDDFVIECQLHQETPATLLLEVWRGETFGFRQSVHLQPGPNFLTLPAKSMLTDLDWPHARLTLYPENDAELQLTFTWLDFVKYHPAHKPKPTAQPASKVKCVVWDLDNTLWQGTLIEDTAAQLRLRPEAVALIHQLDQRGILQSIASKNNFTDAWAVLGRHGLQEYFLYPQINWDPKSANIAAIAQRLNIHLDTFALIDDSEFERAEVSSALPMMRVLSETAIPEILTRPEFDQPITEMSQLRRASYQIETQREQARENFTGQYLEFLQSSHMQLTLFVPQTESEIARCHELVQRSNQLNLSSRRYTLPEFRDLLATPGMLCLAMQCADKFGNYGTVGLVTVDENTPQPILSNFVLSCRVAQKRVEHAFFQWLALREKARGHTHILADLVITDRNGPLVSVFQELLLTQSADSPTQLTMDLTTWNPTAQLVQLTAPVLP